MTTYNEDQFATRVLKDLGLIGAEETPSAADMEWAKETAMAEIMMLSAIGLPIWNGSELSIPQEYLTPLSRRVCLAVAPSFGLTDIASAQSAMKAAEMTLVVMAAPRGARPMALKSADFPSRSSFRYATGS
jgi:hypothetical protein